MLSSINLRWQLTLHYRGSNLDSYFYFILKSAQAKNNRLVKHRGAKLLTISFYVVESCIGAGFTSEFYANDCIGETNRFGTLSCDLTLSDVVIGR